MREKTNYFFFLRMKIIVRAKIIKRTVKDKKKKNVKSIEDAISKAIKENKEVFVVDKW